MKTSITSLIALLAIIMLATSSFAQPTSVSGEFTLQGRLTTTAGTPVADGMHVITINIYLGSSSNVIFTQTDSVMTVAGVFSLLVGAEGLDSLHVVAGNNYSIGVMVDNGTELSPRLRLSSVLNALTADIAANAEAVGGFHVSPGGNSSPNSLLTLNGNGHINTSLLDTSDLITSINGLHGHVVLQTGNGISVSASGNILSLNFTGSDSGTIGLSLPFLDTVNLASTALGITNTLSGSVASFINTGAGTALNLSASAGSALTATANSSANASIQVMNNAGTAIDAMANTATAAVLRVQNTASAASAQLISAANSGGTVVLDVLANGQTSINSTVANALNVTTSASGEAALNVNGGIKVSGPAGTGQISAGNLTATITNAFAKANSIIMITPTGGIGFPLTVASQGNGSFVVSVVSGITSLLTNASFNYLIINQ